MPRFTNKVKSRSKLKALMNKLKNLDGSSAAAGYDDSVQHSTAKLGMATLAYIHEMGAPAANIVPRPFMTQAARYDADNIPLKDRGDVVEQYLYLKKPLKPLLNALSRRIEDNITFAMDVGNFVVTSNPTPLLDTWELREGVLRFVMTGKNRNS